MRQGSSSLPARLALAALGLALTFGSAGPSHAQKKPAPSAAASKPADPFDAGVAADGRGDYAEAARQYKLAATQGDAEAQDLLGAMYKDGRGVPQDYVEAVRRVGDPAVLEVTASSAALCATGFG